MKIYYVYIIADCKGGYTYMGFTNNLIRRVIEHKLSLHKDSYTAIHNTKRLVYYESSNDVSYTIYREKQVKKWKRSWKLQLINEMNPEWKDLIMKLEVLMK